MDGALEGIVFGGFIYLLLNWAFDSFLGGRGGLGGSGLSSGSFGGGSKGSSGGRGMSDLFGDELGSKASMSPSRGPSGKGAPALRYEATAPDGGESWLGTLGSMALGLPYHLFGAVRKLFKRKPKAKTPTRPSLNGLPAAPRLVRPEPEGE